MDNSEIKNDLVNRYQQLINISCKLNSELDLNILLSKIVSAAADVSDAEEASILMYDPIKEELYFQAATNIDTQLKRGMKVPIEKSIAGWIVEHKEPVIVEDPQSDSRHFDHVGEITNIEVHSLLGIPLITKREIIGVLEVINKKDGEFTKEDEKVLLGLGGQASVAIENSRLFQQSDLIEEFVHELRTPLSALSAATHLLKNKRVDEDQKHRMIEILDEEIDALTDMSTSFLDLARLETGRKQYNVQNFNFSELLFECHGIMESEARELGIAFKLALPEDLPVIRGDRSKLKQAIINLLNNAIKYNKEEGVITLSCKATEAELVITISDTGIGIPNKDTSRIFEKFYRVPEHREKIPGTGLGLSVVKQIINGHGGRIDVESELGVGTTFTIYLPHQ
ncbi:MAG: GAF domain-containing sensor histidine kinase [Anaerolineales bacterium]